MRPLLAATAFATATLLGMQAALAAPAPGTQLNGVLTTELTSKNAYVGEPVTLTNVTSANGSNSIVGARLYGTVTSVTPAGQGRSGQIAIRFTRLSLHSGTSYAVDGVVTGMKVNTKSNALKEAAGAVGGMIIGNMIGKTIFHMSGGGFLGAAGGYLAARNNRENITIPQGSVVGVRLNVIRRQPSRY